MLEYLDIVLSMKSENREIVAHGMMNSNEFVLEVRRKNCAEVLVFR